MFKRLMFLFVIVSFILTSSVSFAGTYSGLLTSASNDNAGFSVSGYLSPASLSEIANASYMLLGIRPSFANEFFEFYLTYGVPVYSSPGPLNLTQQGGGIKWKFWTENESWPSIALLFDIDGINIGSAIAVHSDNLFCILSKKIGSYKPYGGIGWGAYIYNQQGISQISSTSYSFLVGLEYLYSENLKFLGDIGYASYGEVSGKAVALSSSKLTTSFGARYIF